MHSLVKTGQRKDGYKEYVLYYLTVLDEKVNLLCKAGDKRLHEIKNCPLCLQMT